MKKITSLLLILVFSMFSYTIKGQQYLNSLLVNQSDSGHITASYLYDDSKILTGSLNFTKFPSGGSTLPSQIQVGEMVLRKLDHAGSLIWQVDYPGSTARIMGVKTSDSGDVIITGAYYDSLRLTPTVLLPAAGVRANAFVAAYDASGNFKWAYNTIPDQFYSKFFYNFDIRDNKIYIPYYEAFGLGHSLLVLNSLGDSIDMISLADKTMLVSHFEFDDNGNLFLCGTADPQISIGGATIGDGTIFGYGAFVAKLDSNFNQLWSDLYSYVTIDFYPAMAINNNLVVFYVDTMPQSNGIGNHHILKYYDQSGNKIRIDSVGPGFFSWMHKIMAITKSGDGFLFSTLEGFNTISFQYVDTQFNYQELAKVNMKVPASNPWFISNDSLIYYNHSFNDSFAIVQNVDTILNPKPPQNFIYPYQQILMHFSPGVGSIGLVETETARQSVTLYPNPSVDGTINLSITGLNEQEVVVSLYSLQGSLIDNRRLNARDSKLTLDFADVSEGVYLVRVQNQNIDETVLWVR